MHTNSVPFVYIKEYFKNTNTRINLDTAWFDGDHPAHSCPARSHQSAVKEDRFIWTPESQKIVSKQPLA